MVKNFGISFGWNFIGVEFWVVLIEITLIYWYFKYRNWRILPVIVGGALNLMERVIFGYVTDYWRIPFTNIYNNLNDWLIFGGVSLLIWQIVWDKK